MPEIIYDETNVPPPDVRVIPVVRYQVTCYYHPYKFRDGNGACPGVHQVVAEIDNESRAQEVAEAMGMYMARVAERFNKT